MKFVPPRKHLQQISRIPHAIATREGLETLDRNERTVDFPAEAMEQLRRRITPFLLRAYPEPEPLYRKLSSWLRLPRERILLTSGCDGALRSVYETFVNPGEEALSVRPTYAMVPLYAQIAGAVSREVGFHEDLSLPVEEILERIGRNTKIVVLAHPNQPIERVYTDTEVRALLERCEETGTLLVMDEAYHHFCPSTAVPHLERYGNLIITRTFSKAFGIAGLRAGYLISHPKNIEALNKVRPMYELHSAAIAAALCLLENEPWMTSYVQQVRQGMEALTEGLERTGWPVFGKWGNSILVKLPEDLPAAQVAQRLKVAGFLVRSENQPPLSNHLRITAGTKDQAERFLKALETILQSVP